MKNLKTLTVIIILTAVAVPLYVYAGSSGGAAEWLRAGVGARAKGMGQAFAAVANDPTAAYYNPAGLSQIREHEFTFMLSNMSLGRTLNYLSYSHPLSNKSRTISVSWLGLGVDEIDERSEAGAKEGTFNYANNAFQVSYSQELFNNLSCGLSLKYIDSKYNGLKKVSNGQSDGYGMDIGFLYRMNEKFSFGLSVQDAVSSLKWETGKDEDIPRMFRLGAAGRFFNGRLLISTEADNESYSKETRLYMGAEYTLFQRIGLRMGSNDSHFTGGLSYSHPTEKFTVKLDYAFLQDTFSEDYGLNESHLFSLGLSF